MTPRITFSLHDALPICAKAGDILGQAALAVIPPTTHPETGEPYWVGKPLLERSEEHTSELQSHVNLVCRLLLDKKKVERKQKPFTPRLDMLEGKTIVLW